MSQDSVLFGILRLSRKHARDERLSVQVNSENSFLLLSIQDSLLYVYPSELLCLQDGGKSERETKRSYSIT